MTGAFATSQTSPRKIRRGERQASGHRTPPVNSRIARKHPCGVQSPALALAVATLFWSGNFVAGRALRGSIDPLTLNFLRWMIALVFIAPFVWQSTVAALPTLRREWRLSLRSAQPASRRSTWVFTGAPKHNGNKCAVDPVSGSDRDPAGVGMPARATADDQANWRCDLLDYCACV